EEQLRQLQQIPGETIRHALADIFLREEFRDSDLRGVQLTVSAVEVSRDLRHATVFVIPLLGARAEPVTAALNRHAGFVRRELGRAVRFKYLPELRFRLDRSFDEGDHVEAILGSDKVRRDLEPGSGSG
ncbi:MAG: 30S ribosome-binding factor RbfA, partial [Rhodothalassiaceae bacterium]